jgi:hypothetical protein
MLNLRLRRSGAGVVVVVITLVALLLSAVVAIGYHPTVHAARSGTALGARSAQRSAAANLVDPTGQCLQQGVVDADGNWGATINSIDGVAVHDNGGNTNNWCVPTVDQNGNPYPNGGHYPYGTQWQCVELVQRYFATRWQTLPIWQKVDVAPDMFDNPTAGVVAIANGSPSGPQHGDALVFNGGPYLLDNNGNFVYDAHGNKKQLGHVALVMSVSGGTITAVEQNVLSDSAHHIQEPNGIGTYAIDAHNVVTAPAGSPCTTPGQGLWRRTG